MAEEYSQVAATATRESHSAGETKVDREDLARRLQGVVHDVRSRRLQIEDEWLKAHDAWIGVQTYSFYESEFKHFIPAFRRTIEKTVVRTVEQLMPHHEFYQVYPGDDKDEQGDTDMLSVHRYMDWLLNDWIKIRKMSKQLVRTYYLYSRCISKSTVKVYDMPQMKEGRITGSIKQVWPDTRAVDPFTFYLWPETATRLEDATLVFEDVIMPYQDYAAMQATMPDTIDPIKPEDLRPPIYPFHVAQRLDRVGMVTPEGVRGLAGDSPIKQQFVQLSELYFKGDGGRWIMGWLVWNLPEIRFTRLHLSRYPRPPYRIAVARELPNQHYTPGMGQDIEALQVLLNDQFNQGEEARAVSSGPPVILDPARVKRADSFVFGYRRKWYGDPAGVKMLEIPDTSVNALRAAQFTLQYMEGSGPQGLGAGQPVRGTPRGSAAVSQLVAMAGADIVDAAKTIEEDCLTPTLQDLYDLTCAFVPDLQIVQIPGAEGYKPLVTTMSELFGGWRFKWAGASRFQDKQSDAQQALSYLQTLTHLADQLPAQGYKVDWATLTRVLWKDIFGERRLANIIEKMSPQEQQQWMQQQMAMMQAGKQQGGNRPPGPQAALPSGGA